MKSRVDSEVSACGGLERHNMGARGSHKQKNVCLLHRSLRIEVVLFKEQERPRNKTETNAVRLEQAQASWLQPSQLGI